MAQARPLPSSCDDLDPQEAAYRALHGEREALERELTLAQQQQQFGSDGQKVAVARDRETELLRDLDRVLTLIRAAEVRRTTAVAARRWQ